MHKFNNKLRKYAFKVIGLPIGSSDYPTRKVLLHFNKICNFFLTSLRNGHEQDENHQQRLRVRMQNIFLRSTIIFTIVRITLGMSVENYYFDLFLANPFSGNKSMKVFLFLFLMDLAFICLFLLREYCLHLEGIGRFQIFKVFHRIQRQGFNHTQLGLSYKQCKLFHKILHFMMVNSIRIISNTIILLLLSTIGLKVLNFASFSTAAHFVFLLVHLPIECVSIFTVSVNFTSLVTNFGSYVALESRRFNTLIELIDENIVTISSDSAAFRKMNRRVVYVFNHFDRLDSDFKYLLQYFFIMVSVAADFSFFVAIILDFDSDIVTQTVAFNSIIIQITNIIAYYLFAHFYQKTIDMHKRYVSMLLNAGSASLVDKLKALEILDRTGSPYVGLSIGDFCRLKRSTCIFYILENASFLMLLTCNIRA
uniref:Gustatory receptor n=1 Tax=Tetranychus urticae TaxID=32264 RepID=T1L5A5_TETUR